MSGIKDFKKVANANEETSKLQERLQEYFQPITRCPIIDVLRWFSCEHWGTDARA